MFQYTGKCCISWIERVITVDAMLRRIVRSSNSEQGIWQFVFSHCETSVKSVLSSAANMTRSSAFISFGVKNISGRLILKENLEKCIISVFARLQVNVHFL